MSRYRDPRRTRRPGRNTIPVLFAGLICVLAASASLAGLVLVWDASPGGSLVLMTSAVQAALLGLVLMSLVARLRIRSAALAMLIGLMAGGSSLALVHLGHYIKFVTADLPRLIREEPLRPEQRRHLLELHREDPFGFADANIFLLRTGRTGFPGFMALRNFMGVEVAGRRITGWPLWWIWGAEGLVIVLVPGVMAAARASRPYCSDCGEWHAARPVETRLPDELAVPMAEAIREGDSARVAALMNQVGIGSIDGEAAVRVFACPRCGRGRVDAARVVGDGNRRRVEWLLRGQPAEPAVVEALGVARGVGLPA